MKPETEMIKAIGIEDLKEKFGKLMNELKNTNINLNKLQQTLSQEQNKAQQLVGAMQSIADLMVLVIGQDEAQKIINELQESRKKE